jgi:hypothetical protein
MQFYEIDSALQEAIDSGDKPVTVRIEIDRGGFFEAVFEQDILEASFYGLKEAAGGTSYWGDVLLDNPRGIYSVDTPGQGANREVRVSFSLGEGLPYFQRFVMYVDDKGFQDIRGPGRERRLQLGLRDLSYPLRKTDEHKDWTAPAVFTYVTICDKTQPEKSLVHGLAKRAGLAVSDIDCSTIPITLPYVKLRKNLWAELSELAKTYRAHLECAPEKPLVFAHSCYQTESKSEEEYSYTFRGRDIFYLRKAARADLYRNTVRLKINLPVVLEKQAVWRYDDTPVLYDEFLQGHYPFRALVNRNIEMDGYEAVYSIKDINGKERDVIYADHIDTKGEAENRLDYDGGPFGYAVYDVTSHTDRALVKLRCEGDGDLYGAAIYGRPIVFDLNRSCFVRDSEAAALHGTCALNVSGSYFSADMVGDKPQYEDWVNRELMERSGKMPSMAFFQNGVSQSETPAKDMVTAPSMARGEVTVKTHRGVFHARCGAKVKIETEGEILKGTVNALSLRYRRDAAFMAAVRITEE